MTEEKRKINVEPWSKDQVELLIDAVKEEHCLYASDLPVYHNKNLRKEALQRVHQKVVTLRPRTTVDECQRKFGNMRKQFSIELSKVKESIKSGTGTDDVYKPSLWYYSLLHFLNSYITTRRSINSLEQNKPTLSQSSSTLMYESESDVAVSSEQVQQINISQSSGEEEMINPGPSTSHEQSLIASGPISPALSSPTTSGVPVRPSILRKGKKRSRVYSDEEFSGAIGNLAEAIRQPVIINCNQDLSSGDTTIKHFLSFIGSILQEFHDEELKLDVMNDVTQAAMNAKTLDLQRRK